MEKSRKEILFYSLVFIVARLVFIISIMLKSLPYSSEHIMQQVHFLSPASLTLNSHTLQ